MEIKVMKNVDVKFLLGGIAALAIGVLTVTGHVQHVIHFADPINEMFFAALAFIMGIGCLAATKK